MRIASYLHRYADFVRDLATMMSGKTIAAAIALFTTPIVSRLFEPSDFGVAAVFASIIGITSNISSLSYTKAIVIPKLEDDALELMAFSFRVVLLFCLAFLFVVAMLRTFELDIAAFNLLGAWVWLLPLGTLMLSVIQMQEGWLTRRRSFGVISASLVAGNSIAAGSRITAGLSTGTSVYGLIVGQMLGILIRLASQWQWCRSALRVSCGRMGFASVRRVARKYRDFPLFDAPAGLVLALGQNLPILLFGSMFSPAVAGFFAMANRLSKVPVTIVGNAMRRVFLQRAAAINNSGRPIRRAFLLTIGGLVALGILPFTFVWYYGEPILTWLLGAKWSMAGRYLEIIAPWMFMLWIISPCNAVFMVLRRQGFWLGLQTILTILRLGAFGVAYFIQAGPEWTLGAFVFVTVIGSLLTLLITTWMTTHGDKQLPRAGEAQ